MSLSFLADTRSLSKLTEKLAWTLCKGFLNVFHVFKALINKESLMLQLWKALKQVPFESGMHKLVERGIEKYMHLDS